LRNQHDYLSGEHFGAAHFRKNAVTGRHLTLNIGRHFLDVAGRAVHYRRAGDGPPLVMLHGSPGDSQMLAEEIVACAANFTVFALDTAGFGYSDALPGEVLTVKDLARATAEAMLALGLPPCPVYGTHTGAAIAIELGLGWPWLVTGLVMEGLPAFTEIEIEALFATYFAPMVTDPLGGHLVSTWMRFRDQFTWFPWTSRDVTRLNAIDQPDAAAVDLWVSMFYRSCKTYRPAYRAACYYGQAAIRAAAALNVPAIYMAAAEDMLFPHLDRLPALKPGQRIERLASDPGRRIAAIARFAREFTGMGNAPALRQMAGGLPRLLVDGPHGQVFVRRYGNPARPALLLLHDAPGTGLGMEELAQSLAATHYVILPDHPGCGLSDAPPADDILSAAADNILAVADALELARFSVAGAGCGAAVAACLAARGERHLTRFIVADVMAPDASVAAAIAPAIDLSPTGAHWVQAWLMLRDAQIYQPWFDGRIAAQRGTQGNFGADWLHGQTAALMEGRASYHLLPRAAALYPTAEMFRASGVDVLNPGVLPDFIKEFADEVDA
jgi:pimeloyl-ACP methyl ester carboxylesterase